MSVHHPPLKRATIFILSVLLTSYALVLFYFLLGGKWQMPGALVLSILYMFMPLAVSLVLTKAVYRSPLPSTLSLHFRPNRWWLVAWFFPPIYALATLAVSLLLPGVTYTPGMEGMIERMGSTYTPEQMELLRSQLATVPVHPILMALGSGLLAGITVNAIAGFGEEAGWRGFLLTQLKSLGFWKSSAVIGVVWGVWHAPLILLGHNYPQHPVAGVFLMTLWTLLLSPLMCFITVRAKSVLAAAIFHGTLNGTLGIALLMIRGGSDLTVGATGLAGIFVLAVCNAGLFVFRRRLALV